MMTMRTFSRMKTIRRITSSKPEFVCQIVCVVEATPTLFYETSSGVDRAHAHDFYRNMPVSRPYHGVLRAIRRQIPHDS